MKRLVKFSALFLGISVATGCATIVSKSSYPVRVQSNPSGVAFTITNRAGVVVSHGVTPQIVTLKAGAGYFKGEKYKIIFKGKDGQSRTIELDTGLDGWYLGGNLLFGGLIGYLIVDPLTGAMYTLPEEVNADLTSLSIMSLDDVTPQQREKLKPLAKHKYAIK